MTRLTATLSRTMLLAASQAASKETTRYCLNGVLVEITEKSVIYVAMDGHILFAVREESKLENTLLGHFIIPIGICQDKRLKNKNFDPVSLVASSDNLILDDALIFKPIDGKFPDWRRVCPKELDGKPAHYNPHLLTRLAKAG